MKIKSIEYENFRNFKDRGKIVCSTDGRVTIIYGKNGDGKTTLHQLLHWIFYGNVNFNKTATNVLYNLTFAEEAPLGVFDVWGRVEFEHNGTDYLLRRTSTYEKTSIVSKLPEAVALRTTEVVLQEKDKDNNWKPFQGGKPEEFVEKLIPSNLSEYFFFDGESMIADLKLKSADSSGKLRDALYSMFDLDILQMAIDHIGDKKSSKTVIGKLFLDKGDDVPGSKMSGLKAEIENLQGKIEEATKNKECLACEQEEKKILIKELSEKIGSTKSRADFEKQRKSFQKDCDLAQKTIEKYQVEFGENVMEYYPKLLISKAVLNAKSIIRLKEENSTLPPGLSKELISYLTNDERTECICGNPLCAENKAKIKFYLNELPPRSYSSLYQEFTNKANMAGSDREIKEKFKASREEAQKEIENIIFDTLEQLERIEHYEEEIRKIDLEQKKSADIEQLVTDRQFAEARLKEIEVQIGEATLEIRKGNAQLKQYNNEFEKLAKSSKKAEEIQHQIEIMTAVREHFNAKLKVASETYSKHLQENIQILLDTMLISKREVSVGSDFSVQVKDSHGDESKSEGQFAIVSFAYIGGIFKLLQNEESLKGKEYPLVLDGPFSKLDEDRRQSVVDTISTFAPQVILFSKDSLQDVFAPEQIGRVWTLESNDEQNIARAKEGYHWS